MKKLIRDKLDQVIDSSNLEIVNGSEYDLYLNAKLDEEIAELRETNFKDLSEFADVIEVMQALLHRHTNNNMEDVETVRLAKLSERGGFTKGLILTTEDE